MAHRRQGSPAKATAALDHARDILQGAALRYPESSIPATRLGNLRRAAGNLPEAKAAYRRALEIDPRDGQAYLGLALVARAEGRDSATVEIHPTRSFTASWATFICAIGAPRRLEACLRAYGLTSPERARLKARVARLKEDEELP